MARIRSVKPDFFQHESLYDSERSSGLPLRLAFAGLWTQCDREGRFEWRPRQLKLNVLPYDDVDFGAVLDALAAAGFLVRYEVAGKVYGQVPSWRKHQHINIKEPASTIPAPDEDGTGTVPAPCQSAGKGEGKERKGEERTREARVGGPLSDGWEPDETGKAACTVRGLDPTAVLRKFRHWHRSKATSSADWSAEWLLWVDRERPPNGSAGPPKVKTPGQVAEDERLAKLAAVTAERFRAGGRA